MSKASREPVQARFSRVRYCAPSPDPGRSRCRLKGESSAVRMSSSLGQAGTQFLYFCVSHMATTLHLPTPEQCSCHTAGVISHVLQAPET